MKAKHKHNERVLAIDPCHRGVGFVLLDKGERLADWGVFRNPNHKTAPAVASVTLLMERYRPSLLVVETIRDGATRRGTRAKLLIRKTSQEAEKRGIRICPVSMARVNAVFRTLRATKKEARASILVKRFPALALYRPPYRRPWTSEDTRMAIFDALSFALARDSKEDSGSHRTS